MKLKREKPMKGMITFILAAIIFIIALINDQDNICIYCLCYMVGFTISKSIIALKEM